VLTEREYNAGKSVDQILSENGIAEEDSALTAAESGKRPDESYREGEREDIDVDRITSNLGHHVHRAWDLARQAKEEHQTTLLQCLRQREGFYDPDKLNVIREQGGSEIYMLLTQLKIRSAKAWITEIMLGANGELPFGTKPTPVPDLPKGVLAKIRDGVRREAEEALQAGLYPTPEKIRKRTTQVAGDVMKAVEHNAARIAKRMHKHLHDELVHADWRKAFVDMLDDFLTYPVAFMKGPFNRMGEELAWDIGPRGEAHPKVTRKAQRRFEAVSPFDIYPAPDARSVHDGYLIERMKLRRDTLYDMIGVPTYDETAIREIIREYGDKGFRLNIHRDTERDRLEGRNWDDFSNDTTIDCLSYWGKIRGAWLVEWGLPRRMIEDMDRDYEANVMMVGPHVFRAALNPNPLGRRPYFDCSLERANNTIFNGKGLSQIIRDLQDMCNAAARSLANNMALASGPMVEIMIDRLAPGETVTDIIPWRQFQTTESKVGSGSGSRAINFFQPNSNANELMNVYQFFSQLADEYSGIPPYTMGSNPSGGAASTASGLGMLIEGAARGIKLAVSELDKVTTYNVECMFHQVMLYDDVPHIKGDLKIVATGTKGVLNREQSNMRRMELLNIIGQPQMMQMTGPTPVVEALREMYEGFNLDPSKLPSEDELMQRMVAMQKQAQAENQPGGRAPNPKEATLDGRNAGGPQAQ